jgi:hypothetical protein
MGTMAASPASDLIRRLEDGLTKLGRLVREHPNAEDWSGPQDNGWTAHDVLVHMRASSEILTPRIYQTLVRDHPPLPGFDDRRWAEVANYASMSFSDLFARIAIPRYELIETLRRLSPADWQRTGLHEEHGEISIEAIASHIAGHDEEHLAQIEELLEAPVDAADT